MRSRTQPQACAPWVALGVALLGAVAGCRSDSTVLDPVAQAASPSAAAGMQHGTPLESLEGSASPLRERFNDDRGSLRFIAILSPT